METPYTGTMQKATKTSSFTNLLSRLRFQLNSPFVSLKEPIHEENKRLPANHAATVMLTFFLFIMFLCFFVWAKISELWQNAKRREGIPPPDTNNRGTS